MEVLENFKTCWICLAKSDDDEDIAEWVKPCRCRGTIKWVHQNCLLRWVDVKSNQSSKIFCNRCAFEYVIQCSSMGVFAIVFEKLYTIAVNSSDDISFIIRVSNDLTSYTGFEFLLHVCGFFLITGTSSVLLKLEDKVSIRNLHLFC